MCVIYVFCLVLVFPTKNKLTFSFTLCNMVKHMQNEFAVYEIQLKLMYYVVVFLSFVLGT